MKWLVKWWHLPPLERGLVIEMALTMGMIRVGLKMLSLNKLKKTLDWMARSFPGQEPVDDQYREQVVWAATTLGRSMLADQPCLTQALAVQMYYQRMNIPAELCIGVAKENNERLLAHAWIESDGQVVIGGSEQVLEQYTRLPAIDWNRI